MRRFDPISNKIQRFSSRRGLSSSTSPPFRISVCGWCDYSKNNCRSLRYNTSFVVISPAMVFSLGAAIILFRHLLDVFMENSNYGQVLMKGHHTSPHIIGNHLLTSEMWHWGIRLLVAEVGKLEEMYFVRCKKNKIACLMLMLIFLRLEQLSWHCVGSHSFFRSSVPFMNAIK